MRIATLIAAGILIASGADAAPFVDGKTSTQIDPALSQAPPSPFKLREDGGLDHPASLGQCPATFDGFRFREESVFKEDGTDVGCQYNGDESDTHLTVYFYQTDRYDTAVDAAQEAGEAIVNRFSEAEHLAEESKSCGMMIDLLYGLELAAASDTDTTITTGLTPCHIFRIAQGFALVTTDKIGPWLLKVRITETESETDMNALMMQASKILNFERGAMNSKTGPIIED